MLFSVVTKKFVVYGRLSRQLVPFFCLSGAYCLHHMRMANAWGKKIVVVLCISMVFQAAMNYSRPLQQSFPQEFSRKAEEKEQLLSNFEGRFRTLYNRYIYPLPEKIELPPHEVLLQALHPLQFLPYQYEGYSPEQRGVLRTTDIHMRLIYIPK